MFVLDTSVNEMVVVKGYLVRYLIVTICLSLTSAQHVRTLSPTLSSLPSTQLQKSHQGKTELMNSFSPRDKSV